MGRKLELTGKQFGNWYVVKFSGMKNNLSYWECVCSCGTKRIMRGARLTEGSTKSCGCSRRNKLVGERFGRLLVLSYFDVVRGDSRWLCKCECGTKKLVLGVNLKSGATVSCGCYSLELAHKLGEKTETIDLIGKIFNRLEVISLAFKKSNKLYWKCVCSCGNGHIARGDSLRDGSIQSCGCYSKEMRIVPINTGETFNRLTVVEFSHINEQGCYCYKCVCECNNATIVSGSNLKSGKVKSCGCLVSELMSLRCGELSPNWKGGVSQEPYCYVWGDLEYKKDLKERDNNNCMNPACRGNTNRLCLHHINYNKKNCHPWNLITLCYSCNGRANYNRDFWEKYYNRIMQYTYNYLWLE